MQSGIGLLKRLSTRRRSGTLPNDAKKESNTGTSWLNGNFLNILRRLLPTPLLNLEEISEANNVFSPSVSLKCFKLVTVKFKYLAGKR